MIFRAAIVVEAVKKIFMMHMEIQLLLVADHAAAVEHRIIQELALSPKRFIAVIDLFYSYFFHIKK
jgi:hypothetical protein